MVRMLGAVVLCAAAALVPNAVAAQVLSGQIWQPNKPIAIVIPAAITTAANAGRPPEGWGVASGSCRNMIATIKKYKEYLAHYHTGGVPGRNEIDDTQEINYPAVMRAIVDTGYKGFVAQEFIPKREPIASLRQAVGICDV